MNTKSFRGLIASDEKRKIKLSTNQGLIGYRIVKFQVMHNEPGELGGEHTLKVFTAEPPAINNTINFNDPTLLAAAYYQGRDGPYLASLDVVFETTKFNQDIWITHLDTLASPGTAANYYLELELVKLNLDEATVATLKDMRGRE
jgi:hypothetical protein